MKAFIAILFALFIAGSNCQQVLTMENCVYDIGVVVADISLYYKDRNNRQTISKLRSDIQTLYDQCLTVLPKSLSASPCEALRAQYVEATKSKNPRAVEILKAWQNCLYEEAEKRMNPTKVLATSHCEFLRAKYIKAVNERDPKTVQYLKEWQYCLYEEAEKKMNPTKVLATSHCEVLKEKYLEATKAKDPNAVAYLKNWQQCLYEEAEKRMHTN